MMMMMMMMTTYEEERTRWVDPIIERIFLFSSALEYQTFIPLKLTSVRLITLSLPIWFIHLDLVWILPFDLALQTRDKEDAGSLSPLIYFSSFFLEHVVGQVLFVVVLSCCPLVLFSLLEVVLRRKRWRWLWTTTVVVLPSLHPSILKPDLNLRIWRKK